MTDQEIKFLLKAETSQLSKALDKAAKDVERLNKKIEQTGKAGKSLDQTNRSFATLATHIAKIVSIYAAATVAADLVKTTMEFEQALKQVQIVSGATAAQLGVLEEKARSLGATTQYTASDVATAMQQMAMAGMDSEQIYTGIGDVLNLAATGMTDLANAAEIAMGAMHAYNLTAADMGDITDILTKATTNSATTIDELGRAIAKVGPVAHAYGVTLEETVAELGVMADAGRKGAEAGTQLKIIMSRLAGNREAAKYIKELGVDIYDTTGKLLPFETQLKNIKSAMDQLAPEKRNMMMSLIFGEEGKAAAEILLTSLDKTAVKLKELKAAMREDFAATSAKAMMDTLKGDFKSLQSSIERVALTIGESLIPHLRNAVQELTDFFRSMDADALHEFGDAIGGIVEFLADMVTGLLGVVEAFGKWNIQMPMATSSIEVILATMGALYVLGKKLPVTGAAYAVALGRVRAAIDTILVGFRSLSALLGLSGPVMLGILAVTAATAALIDHQQTLNDRTKAAADYANDSAEKTQLLTDAYEGLKRQYVEFGAIEKSQKNEFLSMAKERLKSLDSEINKLQYKSDLTKGEAEVLRALEKEYGTLQAVILDVSKMDAFDKSATSAEKLANGMRLTSAEIKKAQDAMDKFHAKYASAMQKAENSINTLLLRESKLLTDIKKLSDERVVIEEKAAQSRYDINASIDEKIFQASVAMLDKKEDALTKVETVAWHNYQKYMELYAKASEELSAGRIEAAKKYASEAENYLDKVSKKDYDTLALRRGWAENYYSFRKNNLNGLRKLSLDAIDAEEKKAKEANLLKLEMKKAELEAIKQQVAATYKLVEAIQQVYDAHKGEQMFDPDSAKRALAAMDGAIAKVNSEIKKTKLDLKIDKAQAQAKAIGVSLNSLFPNGKYKAEIETSVDMSKLTSEAKLAGDTYATTTKTAIDQILSTADIELPIAADSMPFKETLTELTVYTAQQKAGMPVDAEVGEAKDKLASLFSQIEDDPIQIAIDTDKAIGAVDAFVANMSKENINILAETDVTPAEVDLDAFINTPKNTTVKVGADISTAKNDVDDFTSAEKHRTDIEVDADTTKASLELDHIENQRRSAKIKADADTRPAATALNDVAKKEYSAHFIAQADTSQAKSAFDEIAKEVEVDVIFNPVSTEVDDEIEFITDEEIVKDVEFVPDTSAIEKEINKIEKPTKSLHRIEVDSRKVDAVLNNIQKPTHSVHTIDVDASRAFAVISQLEKNTHSTHTIYVKKVSVNSEGGYIDRYATGGSVTNYAHHLERGGGVPGYDPTDSDKVHALLTGGEFVLRRSAVDYYGKSLLHALNSMALPRFASGGSVGVEGGDTTTEAPASVVINIEGRRYDMLANRKVAEEFAMALKQYGGM